MPGKTSLSAHSTFSVSVVIPCYNEAENIGELYRKLTEVLDPYTYELLFVDDGSGDDTLDRIKQLASEDPSVRYISFSRNFGHQNALKAGLDMAGGDCVISMDADMQHPPVLIPGMITRWQEGYEVVYTIRDDRKNIGFLNRLTSRVFYGLLNLFSETKIQPGSADFRLLDRKVVDVLKKLDEHDLFLRGLVSWVGFRQLAIPYIPEKRRAGKTKYSLSRKIHFATAGITSFSTRPLKISIFTGFIFAFSAFLYGLYAIYEALFTDNTITGWTSLIVSILFIGGIQLIMIGIVGEYLGKLFIGNKRRPNYIIRESNFKSNNQH